MPMQINEASGGKVLIVHVSGKLTKADYETFGPEFDRLVREHGRLRVLIDMAGFHGWDVGAAWQDLKLGLAHFSDVERLALVGERKWQHGMATFSKPFTRAVVRYFDQADAAKARTWVDDGVAYAASEAFEHSARDN